MKQTKNYGMFKLSPYNRIIRERKVLTLMRSIQKANLLEYHPILVNTEMVVQDGQHRLVAAKKLGVPIFYNVVAVEDVMVLLNTNQDRWTLKDFTKHWVDKKVPDYVRYIEIGNRYPFVPRTSLIRLLMMNPKLKYLAVSGLRTFKEGGFKITNEEGAIKTIEMVREIEPFLITGVSADRTFWVAFYRMTNHRDFNFERLLERFKLSGMRINLFSLPREYYRAFEDVYNWHVRANPIRLY